MKKVLASLLIGLSLAAMIGCGTVTTTTTTLTTQSTVSQSSSTTKTYAQTYWDMDANGIEDWTEEEITLNYST